MTTSSERTHPYRKLTSAEWKTEARERFGDDMTAWAFECPQCGDIATAQDFIDATGTPGAAGQECIGRHRAGRGCKYAAYGLISGPWEIAFPPDSGTPVGRSIRAFPLAPAPTRVVSA